MITPLTARKPLCYPSSSSYPGSTINRYLVYRRRRHGDVEICSSPRECTSSHLTRLTHLAEWTAVARFTPFEVRPLQPMLVQPFHHPGWVYEEKADGRVEGWRGASSGPSPAPATSNGANGFPVRRFPAGFTSRVMRPIAWACFQARRQVPDPVVVEQSERRVEPRLTPPLPAEARRLLALIRWRRTFLLDPVLHVGEDTAPSSQPGSSSPSLAGLG